MAQAPLLIHVGYHKTGTTWLQKSLFKPEFGYCPLMGHEECFQKIIRPHDLTFDPRKVRRLLCSLRSEAGGGQVDVISSENLTGNPFYGGRDSVTLARRIHTIAPDARILITIREQTRIIVSVYMQYLSRAGTLPPKDFFRDDPVMGYPAFSPEIFQYHRLVEFYQNLFGYQNVRICTQESLSRSPDTWVRDLADFAGNTTAAGQSAPKTERIGVSQPEYCAGLLRRINHFRSGPAGEFPLLNFKGVARRAYKGVGALGRQKMVAYLFKSNKPITAYVAQRFGGQFAESNHKLKELIGNKADLSGYEGIDRA